MAITPAELYTRVQAVIKEGSEYTQALIFKHLGINKGEVVLVAGVETDVPLDQAFDPGITDYEVWRQVYSVSGEKTDIEIISKTNSSFRVLASIDCAMKFLTTYPNLNIV